MNHIYVSVEDRFCFVKTAQRIIAAPSIKTEIKFFILYIFEKKQCYGHPSEGLLLCIIRAPAPPALDPGTGWELSPP